MVRAGAAETVLRVVAPITPFRNDAGGQPIGDWSHCGMPGYTLCWTWAGTAHLAFERLPADLTLQQSPDTAIWAGQSVTFTAGADPATVAGNPWPIGVMELQWRWIPDDTVSADTLGCGSTSGMKCTRVMRGSGTMYAAAYVNGQQQQKSRHLDVKVPELHLTASKSVVAAPGENDTFTATANGSLTVLGWSFTSDGGGAADRLATSSASIGSRTAKARSADSAASGQQASSSRFAAPTKSRRLASPGSEWDACSSGSAQCTNLVTETGAVDVLAIVNGDTLRASVPVQVVPCPTNDPLLDQPNIRSDFVNLMTLSNPDSVPGAGMDSTHLRGAKRERGMWIYRRDDGSFYSVPVPDLTSDECSISNIWPAPPDPPGARLWAVAHSHPGDDKRPAYGKCYSVDPRTGVQTMCERYPGDPNGTLCTKGNDYAHGGGSDPDWDLTKYGVDVYVINKQGEVWRLPAYTPAGDHLKDRNKRRTTIKGNSNSACNW